MENRVGNGDVKAESFAVIPTHTPRSPGSDTQDQPPNELLIDEELPTESIECVSVLIRKPVENRQLVSYDDLYPTEPLSLHSDGAESSSEEESSDVSSSDSETIMRTALTPIEKEIKGYDPSAEPENGSQFLLKVQQERKQLPKVVSATKAEVEMFMSKTKDADENKPFKVTKVPKCVATPESLQEFLPTQSWMSIITHQFSNLSLKVEYWRAMMAEQGASITLPEGIVLPPFQVLEKKWLLFCFGTKICNQLTSNPRRRKGVSSSDPLGINTFFFDDLHVPLIETKQNQESIPQSTESVEDSLENLVIADQPVAKGEEVVDAHKESEDLKIDHENHSKTSSSGSDSDEEEESYHEKQPPLLSIILNLPIPTVEDLLSMHIFWLQKHGWFHELQGQWIYGLLACLERPLPCDVIANIRKLVRICCALRKRVCETKLAAESPKRNDNIAETGDGCKDDDAEDTIRFKEFVNTLNLFVCLASNYFQQFDLADAVVPSKESV